MRRPTEVPSLRQTLVHANALSEAGEDHSLELAPEEVDEALRDAGAGEVRAAGALSARIRVLPSGDDVFVLGSLTAGVEYRCVRCLNPFPGRVEAEFHLTFGEPAEGEGGEVELHREDMEMEPLRDGVVDLVRVVGEQLLLGLEAHPVCRDGACRGLCPRCGADRNDEGCACPQETVSPHFKALEAWGKPNRS